MNKKRLQLRSLRRNWSRFFEISLMQKKSKSTVWLNRDFIIAGRKRFVKRIFVLENMRTCIVQWWSKRGAL